MEAGEVSGEVVALCADVEVAESAGWCAMVEVAVRGVAVVDVVVGDAGVEVATHGAACG